METTKRLNPTRSTRQKLFALSRNQCAFPNCPNLIIDENGSLLAEICHIESAEERGQRFNPNQTNEERRSFENLILLCRIHHAVTNNVELYPVNVLQKIKAEHEAHAYTKPESSDLIQKKFLDYSLKTYDLPTNLLQLNLDGCDDTFFHDAIQLLKVIASLPPLTRSLYAYSLIHAVIGDIADLFLCVGLFEMSQRINISTQELDYHYSILEQKNLVARWESEDDWRHLAIRGTRFYLCGLDREDNGVYFLCLICKKFPSTVILDIIEDLNFTLLDN